MSSVYEQITPTVQSPKAKVLCTTDFGLRTLELGLRVVLLLLETLDYGHWSIDFGFRALDYGIRTQDYEAPPSSWYSLLCSTL